MVTFFLEAVVCVWVGRLGRGVGAGEVCIHPKLAKLPHDEELSPFSSSYILSESKFALMIIQNHVSHQLMSRISWGQDREWESKERTGKKREITSGTQRAQGLWQVVAIGLSPWNPEIIPKGRVGSCVFEMLKLEPTKIKYSWETDQTNIFLLPLSFYNYNHSSNSIGNIFHPWLLQHWHSTIPRAWYFFY